MEGSMGLDGVTPFPKELIEEYYRKRFWLGITLGQMLDRSCDLYHHKEALVAGKARLTYERLREMTNRAAIAFLELGVLKRDRVLLQIPNWAEFVYAYYGLHKIGAIPVMCIPRFSQREMEHFCEITEATAWIVPRQHEKMDYLPMIEAFKTHPFFLKHILVIDSSAERGPPLPEGTFSFNDLLEKVDLKRYPKDYLQAFHPDPGEVCHLMPTYESIHRTHFGKCRMRLN